MSWFNCTESGGTEIAIFYGFIFGVEAVYFVLFVCRVLDL